jgi:Dolichyl-phosphate-mannose-protein mannosyltransferase
MLKLAPIGTFLDSLTSRTSRTRQLPDWLAIAAACIFVLLAAYQIELPGLNYDELEFANIAQGALDNTWIHTRLGSVPLLVSPYVGALKGWLYIPVFRFFGVSALTIRLPVILVAGATLLIFYQAMRETLGPTFAAVAVWIMAVDPANLFPSRLDRGPTVFMHLFQAAILALWFSYRDKPQFWKVAFIGVCFILGCFDKFNFVWLASAFVIGILVCYPDDVKNLWFSLPRLVPWMAIIFVLIALATMLYLVLPYWHRLPAGTLTPVRIHWNALLSTLSGATVASFIFESPAGIICGLPGWLIIVDGLLVLACLFLPISDVKARENRKNGIFCLLLGFLIFLQIAITPIAGGPYHPNHYSMIFPFPLLAFAFLAKSLNTQFGTKSPRRAGALLGLSAVCLFAVNVHNTTAYLSHFRTNAHYSPQWSPEIYSLSSYINEHGSEWKRIISIDWGLHNQIHTLAPKDLRGRMREATSIFRTLDKKPEEKQRAALYFIFPEGKSLVITFAASEERFPETRRNFLASVATHLELKSRLVKEFWSEGVKIYELYEISRPANGPLNRDAANFVKNANQSIM